MDGGAEERRCCVCGDPANALPSFCLPCAEAFARLLACRRGDFNFEVPTGIKPINDSIAPASDRGGGLKAKWHSWGT